MRPCTPTGGLHGGCTGISILLIAAKRPRKLLRTNERPREYHGDMRRHVFVGSYSIMSVSFVCPLGVGAVAVAAAVRTETAGGTNENNYHTNNIG